ncbi:GGDEF domain-containing protein [Blastococcus sp. TML/M2B]|uniref:diguanylate cyclase domain-containing protein n=1 Tax=Blastococcus sp. TML/M2B TaxID=2798727 RepID=UPI001F5C084D
MQASRVDEAGNIVLTHTDVTSRVRAERTSAWQARHDALTGLPNRSHLHELIDADLSAPRRPVAALFLDVDGFKEVNDSLGHDTGDDLLREIAARLTAAVREGDTVGRLGGDEFVVLTRDCAPDEAEALAERLRRTLARPFELGGRVVRLGASIGIAGTSGVTATCAPPTWSATPTSPCTRRRPPAGTGCTCSTPTCAPRPSGARRWPASCATPSSATSWCCTTSRCCTWPRAAAPAWRRWSAGSTPSAACWPRRSSCPSPRPTTS